MIWISPVTPVKALVLHCQQECTGSCTGYEKGLDPHDVTPAT